MGGFSHFLEINATVNDCEMFNECILIYPICAALRLNTNHGDGIFMLLKLWDVLETSSLPEGSIYGCDSTGTISQGRGDMLRAMAHSKTYTAILRYLARAENLDEAEPVMDLLDEVAFDIPESIREEMAKQCYYLDVQASDPRFRTANGIRLTRTMMLFTERTTRSQGRSHATNILALLKRRGTEEEGLAELLFVILRPLTGSAMIERLTECLEVVLDNWAEPEPESVATFIRFLASNGGIAAGALRDRIRDMPIVLIMFDVLQGAVDQDLVDHIVRRFESSRERSCSC